MCTARVVDTTTGTTMAMPRATAMTRPPGRAKTRRMTRHMTSRMTTTTATDTHTARRTTSPHTERPTMPRVRLAATALSGPALLQLMWLASPALPVGGFSYSEGLEAAVEGGQVPDEAGAARWLGDQLSLSLQRADLPLLASAHRAWQQPERTQMIERISDLNAWALQTRETREFRQQTEQMGRSLTDWLRQRRPDDPRLPVLAALAPAPTWPVAFALAAAVTGASRREALLAFGFSWAENMVQAALKAVPLGQSAGQRLLGKLADALPAAVDAALATAVAGDTARQNLTPMLAIMSARHEAQYSRLFRS